MNKFILIFFLVFLTGCAKEFNKQKILTVHPPVAAKIEGNHLIYISDKNNNEKKIALGTRCLLFSFNSASFILSIIITNKNTIAIAPT